MRGVSLQSYSGSPVYVWWIFLVDVIVQLLVSSELVCVSACGILREATMYMLVEFYLISLCSGCLSLEVVFFVMCSYSLVLVIIRG